MCPNGHHIANVDVTADAITTDELWHDDSGLSYPYTRGMDHSRFRIKCPECRYDRNFYVKDSEDEYAALRDRLAVAMAEGQDEFRLDEP